MSKIHLISAILMLAMLAGCAPERPSDQKGDASTQSKKTLQGDGREALPVAKIDGEEISVGDLERRISGMAPYARVRYSTTAQREELLQSVIVFEVLADEAERRGLKDDPEVLHQMKEVMVRRLLVEEERSKLSPGDITEAEIARYYNEHTSDYYTEPQRRALVIKVRTEKFARDIHAELVAGKSEPDVQKRVLAFRKLSAKHSIERGLSTKGGDVGFLPPANKLRNNREISRRVFELKEIGDFSEPYQHESIWTIVMLMDKRPERTRPLEAVSGEIRQELYESRRKELREKFIADLRAKAKIEIEEENLAKIEPPKGDSQMLDKALLKKSPVRDLSPGEGKEEQGGEEMKNPGKVPVEQGDKQENP